jgi:hypothetical protein
MAPLTPASSYASFLAAFDGVKRPLIFPLGIIQRPVSARGHQQHLNFAVQDAVGDDASLIKYSARGCHRHLKLHLSFIAKETAPFNKKAKCRSEREVDFNLNVCRSLGLFTALGHRGLMQVWAEEPGERQEGQADGFDGRGAQRAVTHCES